MNLHPLQYLILVLFLTTIMISGSYAASAPWVGDAFNAAPCNGKSQGYGPFDYNNRRSIPSTHLYLVEMAHFTPSVENLIRGNAGTLVSDIDYTLRAWPNHHRALNSISRYKLLFPKKRKVLSPVECYFQRAINFSPDDATTRMLFGAYLHKKKHLKAARKQYDKAIELSSKNPIIRYNFGLLLFEQKEYSLAQQQAVIAYDANFPLNGLKNKLKRVKFWPPKAMPEPVENTSVAKPKQP
ncbi:MAG: hypothetical protein COB26_02905 [Piscirickettsiaceae bacterium]|nr:MAG: hypothetical protein COB26_02905 [Piscirickettsiaceae bacterium]